jgi:hypothetical protein
MSLGILDLPRDWSPTGEWITCKHGNETASLIVPDGKKQKSLGERKTDYLAFSKNVKHLYRINVDQDRSTLLALCLVSLGITTIKDLGHEWMPDGDHPPGIRFNLAPDGKSFVTRFPRHETTSGR